MVRPRFRVDLFAEDTAHEQFLKCLVERLGKEEGLGVAVRVRSARGGHGRTVEQLKIFQSALQAGTPDLLVVAVDANCNKWNAARGEIAGVIDSARFPRSIVACPDPHIERWYLADPVSLADRLEVKIMPGKRKCGRDRYKEILKRALMKAGHFPTLGGAEFAAEIVKYMDLYAAARNEPSLKHCIEGIRTAMKEVPRA